MVVWRQGEILLVSVGNMVKGNFTNYSHIFYLCTSALPSCFFLSPTNFLRPSMSGLHLVKQGRDRKKVDVQRDFTVASPAEFVTRFGGNKVIEKVSYGPS